jgi:hypothetical protein
VRRVLERKNPFIQHQHTRTISIFPVFRGYHFLKRSVQRLKKFKSKILQGFYNLKTLLPLDIFANDVLSNIIIFGDVKLVSLKRVMNPVFMIELCKWRF